MKVPLRYQCCPPFYSPNDKEPRYNRRISFLGKRRQEEPMRVHRAFVVVAAGALAWMCTAAFAQETSPRVQGPPPRRFDFFDDHDGRRIADIRLRVVKRERNQVGLDIIISAVGPSVESIPGWTGVRGANRHTAEQLENI